MTPPETPYEAASYALNKFRDRRMADRRFSSWTSEERRMQQTVIEVDQNPDPRLAETARKKQLGLCRIFNKAAGFFK